MTKKSNLLIVSLLITIGLFIYLTLHHFALKVGLGGDSLCTISSSINCDAVATSTFAELAGIPIAILGGVFTFILFCFVGFYSLGFAEPSIYLRTTVRGMLISAAVVSVVMGTISTFVVKVACPFCIGTYLLSFLNLFLGWNLIKDAGDKLVLKNYLGQYKSHIVALALIPFFSWVTTGMIEKNYGLDELNKYVPSWIAQWKAGTEYAFDNNVGLTNNASNPKYTLVEFADFKCPHCKTASQTIHTFLKGRTDVLFVFKPYPLDGNCNDGVTHKGDSSRCSLAAFALCAEKIAQKGWQMHDWIFERQERIISVNDAKSLLPEIEKDLSLDAKLLAECADSAETFAEIKKSTQEGASAKVEGTPAIFMNGKSLPRAHILEVLKQAAKN